MRAAVTKRRQRFSISRRPLSEDRRYTFPGPRDWREFASTVAAYLNHGIVAQAIIDHIETTVQRPVDVQQAKEIIRKRGGFTAALQGLR